jgi:mono/diheme cytochrome c family protein
MQDKRANWISLIALLVLVIVLPIYGNYEVVRMQQAQSRLSAQYMADGIDLYLQDCASCHAANGSGIGKMPALNRAGMAEIPEETLSRIIARQSHGSAMAAWHVNEGGILTDYQIKNVVVLLKYADWGKVQSTADKNGFQAPPEPAIENGLNYLFTENRDDPHQCVACHEEPEVHADAFGINCARCHNTTTWTPAVLTRHDFLLDHGDMGQVDCKTCHPTSYVTYDCYGCHEDHQPDEMQEAHLAEKILEFEDCARCHPTGAADEADRLRQGNPEVYGDLGKTGDQLGLSLQPNVAQELNP